MSKFGIRANTISPGFVKTSFFKNFKNKRKKLYKWTISRIPQRWGNPNEIAELITFILSDKCTYLNGEIYQSMEVGPMHESCWINTNQI